MKKIERREFIKAGAVAALGLGLTASAEASAAWPIEVAVYAEYSDGMKKVLPGFNVRVFNRREVQQANSIRCDLASGVVTLQPGLYHITASSQVACDDLKSAPGRVTTDPSPYGGYCRLRYAKDVNSKNELAIAIGTISNANMIPSMIETWLMVEKPAQIVLEHQVGDHTDGMYLQDNAGNSPWHVFARLAIRRQ